ncbi:hypothetical protein Tco_0289311 [Tanacetum coccineum]
MLRACPHHGFTELTQVDTFYNGLNENDQDSLNAAVDGNLLSKTTREALNIIENKSKVRYSRNKLNVSRMNTTSRESVSKTDERIDKLTDQLLTLVEIISKNVVTPAPVKAVEEICVTCSRPHAWYNCTNTDNNQSSVCEPTQRVRLKAITTRSGVAYEGPSIPTNPSPKKVVERETEETTDKEQTNFQGSTAHIPPPVNPIPIPEPDVPKTLPKPNIPYPSRHLRFDISFADALLLMPRFAPTIRNLLMNKEKLLELAKISLNENCSAMLLKKLPEKLGDPGKFLMTMTDRALIDVYGEEITLRVDNEAITFNLDQKFYTSPDFTSSVSTNRVRGDMTRHGIKRVDNLERIQKVISCTDESLGVRHIVVAGVLRLVICGISMGGGGVSVGGTLFVMVIVEDLETQSRMTKGTWTGGLVIGTQTSLGKLGGVPGKLIGYCRCMGEYEGGEASVTDTVTGQTIVTSAWTNSNDHVVYDERERCNGRVYGVCFWSLDERSGSSGHWIDNLEVWDVMVWRIDVDTEGGRQLVLVEIVCGYCLRFYCALNAVEDRECGDGEVGDDYCCEYYKEIEGNEDVDVEART